MQENPKIEHLNSSKTLKYNIQRFETPILKHSNFEMFYNRVFEALNVLSLGFRAIEVFYVRVCNDLT